MAPTVAAIIPVFNRVQMLGRALESVYAQTLPADEVCVVDDGSSDGVREFVEENFPEANYCYQHNQGVSAARNRGVAVTRSSWLAFLDSPGGQGYPNEQTQKRRLRSVCVLFASLCDFPIGGAAGAQPVERVRRLR